jgi:acetyl-CoA carboxylase carboxyl transferase subunit alpha
LWKDRKASPQAAAALKITAADLKNLGLVDDVIPEPLGGAHYDPAATAATVRSALLRHLAEIQALSKEERLKGRYRKFRGFGQFTEATEPVGGAPE